MTWKTCVQKETHAGEEPKVTIKQLKEKVRQAEESLELIVQKKKGTLRILSFELDVLVGLAHNGETCEPMKGNLFVGEASERSSTASRTK
ncbi:hypothetical protein OUZ56_022420 [Daphnia magna]|uniref:Uncharacterized protein n=1 Tax=Daphnia magna TaxID=35525 RepID=A0ABR0AWC7_9CRUS|nr:hypothetical protein OUZ56_022420 [Daphnia magna]